MKRREGKVKSLPEAIIRENLLHGIEVDLDTLTYSLQVLFEIAGSATNAILKFTFY